MPKYVQSPYMKLSLGDGLRRQDQFLYQCIT